MNTAISARKTYFFRRVVSFLLVLTLLAPVMTNGWSLAAETSYIFYPPIQSEPYVSNSNILTAGMNPGAEGVDGWFYHEKSTSNFSSGNYFRTAPHTVLKDARMLELNLSSSNRSIYHAFSEPISGGVYTMSFDVSAAFTTPGSGYYNIRLVNSEGTFATTTSIRFYGDGKVTFGNSNETLLPAIQEDHWYRVTVVYDFDKKISTYYINDSEEDYQTAVENGTGATTAVNLASGVTFTGVVISGMGSSTVGTLCLDNWRVFAGTEETAPPAFISNSSGGGEEPEEPGTYLFHPDFSAEPYLSSPTVVNSGATPGTVGTDNWEFYTGSTSNFSSSNYFRIADHSTMEDRKMLEYYNSTSNRQVYHAFDETLYSGIYTMSFDFEINVKTAGTGYYNLRLLNTAGTAASTTSIRFYGDGSLRIGGSTKILEQNVFDHHWYRLTVVYDLDAKTATYYLNDSKEDYLAAVEAGIGVTQSVNLPAGVGFSGFLIAGAGSSTVMNMHFDNWRVFTGRTEENEPNFVEDTRPLPTRYLFNETFPASLYDFGEYLFAKGAENGTVKDWAKIGGAAHDAEYFRVTEHTKIEDDQIGALYLTSASNSLDRSLGEAVLPGKGVKLTVSMDFLLQVDEQADAAQFYRIALVNGATRRDTTDFRIYANGNITFNNNKLNLAAPLEDLSDWHRLTVVYDLEAMTADYYLDNVFQVTGGKFTIDQNGVTAVRISGPAGAMGELMMDNIRAYVGDIGEESDPPALVDNSKVVYQPNGDSKAYAETTLAADTDYNFDYSFVWTTDPQNLVKFRPDLHIRNMQWLVDNQEALKIRYVMNTGDLVTDSSSQQQWEDSDTSQRLFDSAGIPNGVLAGNHDTSSGTYAKYSQYFGEDRYNGNEWYGGSYENNFGHYDLVTVGDTDFLFLYMSYQYEQESNKEAIARQIDWMNKVLAQYPRHNAVLLFHDYLESNASKGRSAMGQQLFEEVVYPNDNVFMVLCGHVLGTWRQDTEINGRIVHEIVYNYQGMETANGDGKASRYNRHMWGMIRLLQMDVENNQIHFRTFSPINDSITMYDTIDSAAADYERDHFVIDFPFGRADTALHAEEALDASSIVYGQPLNEAKLRTGHMLNSIGSAVSGTFAWENGEAVLNAGTHAVTARFTPDDSYYEDAVVEVTVKVLPREVHVKPDEEQGKALGEADPTLTYTLDGLLTGDVLSGSLSREAGEEAGYYEITAGTLTAGDNYTIVLVGGAVFEIRDERLYASVSGTVVEGDTPLSGVLVSLKAVDSDGAALTAVTDQNGRFAFLHVLEGAYMLTAEAAGYEPAFAAVTIVEGDVQKTFSLVPKTVQTDKAALRSLLSGALSEEQLKGYVQEGADAYRAALQSARRIDADETATQEQIDAAADDLSAAQKALVPLSTAILGDVNGDGVVNTTDARLILQHAVGKLTLGEASQKPADVNGDGRIDTTDARLVLQKSVGKIEEFPVA